MNSLTLKVISDVLYGWLKNAYIVDIRASKNCFYIIFKKRRIRALVFSFHPQAIFIQKAVPKNSEKTNLFQYAKKHLVGSKFTHIDTLLPDKVLRIDLEKIIGTGSVKYRLIAEFLGRNPNIVITDDCGVILYALNLTPNRIDSVRPIRIGRIWPNPTKQYKTPVSNPASGFMRDDIDLDSFMKSYSGIDKRTAAMLIDSGVHSFAELKTRFSDKKYAPIIVNYKQKDMLFPFDIKVNEKTKLFSDFIELFKYLYVDKIKSELFNQKKTNLYKIIEKRLDHFKKKIKNMNAEIKKAENFKTYEESANLIKSNLWKLNPNEHRANVEIVDNDISSTIQLSPKLTILDNMIHLFKRSKKLKKTLQIKQGIIDAATYEIAVVNQIDYDLSCAEDEHSLDEVHNEIVQIGLIKKKKKEKEPKSDNIVVKQTNGVTFYMGKNARGNESVTFSVAGKNDMWLHAKNAPGAHVIIKGKYDAEQLRYAAYMAATHSKSSKNVKVDVDFTLKKYIKKPKGSKLGMVIYKNYQTISVRTDEVWNY